MTISLMLHVQNADVLLFHGAPSDCPPIPRTGDEILHENRRVRLEGIQYKYGREHVEISLLA